MHIYVSLSLFLPFVQNKQVKLLTLTEKKMEGFKHADDKHRYKKFRMRAHSNPLSIQDFDLPKSPEEFDIKSYYPGHEGKISIFDIGCGYGDFLVEVSPYFPDQLALGIEIRFKASRIAQQAILDRREKDETHQHYNNVAVVQGNVMRDLPRLASKGQISTMFVLFPDPQFKNTHVRRRVVSPWLLDEYAFFLKSGGIFIIATDLPELFDYMNECIGKHPLFRRLTDEEIMLKEEEKDLPMNTLTGLGCLTVGHKYAFIASNERTADAQRHARKDPEASRKRAAYMRL